MLFRRRSFESMPFPKEESEEEFEKKKVKKAEENHEFKSYEKKQTIKKEGGIFERDDYYRRQKEKPEDRDLRDYIDESLGGRDVSEEDKKEE